MKKKEHIEPRKTGHEDIIVSAKNGVSTGVDEVLSNIEVPDLSLSEQQELTCRILEAVRNSRERRKSIKTSFITARDKITCTDSPLIRTAAYIMTIIAILCIAAGIAFLITSLMPSPQVQTGIIIPYTATSMLHLRADITTARTSSVPSTTLYPAHT